VQSPAVSAQTLSLKRHFWRFYATGNLLLLCSAKAASSISYLFNSYINFTFLNE
jgi:hypothetical protein